MSKTEFDVDTSVLSDLEFEIKCEIQLGESGIPCENVAKYEATCHHFLSGCRERRLFMCQKCVDEDLAANRILRFTYCSVCLKSSPAITDIIKL